MTPNILEAMKWFAPDLKGAPQAYEFTWVDLGPRDIRDYDEATRKIETGEAPEVLLSQTLPKEMPMPFEMLGVVATHMTATKVETPIAFTYHRSDNDMQVIMRHPTRKQLILTHKGDLSGGGGKDLWYDGDILEATLKYPKFKGLSEADVVKDYIDIARKTYAMLFVELTDKKATLKTYQPVPNPANEKRIRKGKKPLFEWRVIDVTAQHVAADNAAPTGRTHASPRRHMRRGHQRKLSNGKTIWIKQMVVGKIEFGYIHHSYTTGEIK